jgi:hypothetical protein
VNIDQFNRFIKGNSPTIISAAAVAGVVTTAILTHRAALKMAHAVQVEEARRSQKNDSLDIPLEEVVDEVLSRREKFDVAWKCYIPPVAAGAATIACIVWANQIGLRRNAALMAASVLAERAFSEYKDEVVRTLGEKKHEEVQDRIAERRLAENPPSPSQVVIVDGSGEQRCYDMWSGRYFRSDIETIRRAVNMLNKDIIDGNMYADLNELYSFLHMDPVHGGAAVGWNVDNLCDVHFSSHMGEDGIVALAMSFTNPPKADFGKTF